MNKYSTSLLAGAFALVFSGSASAVLITASAPGDTTASVAGATVIDFNGITDPTCPYASCSGDFQYVTGSVNGQYAEPAGINSQYLTVPNPNQNGSAVFELGTSANYFGLFWGSIDSYNTISFLIDGIYQDFTGTFVANQIPGAADGDQTSSQTNRYINFNFGSEFFTAVKIASNGFAFESDNHAYATVPEPGTLALFSLGLAGLVYTRRRKSA